MPMTPALRKFALTTHVTSSIGWVGAVIVFIALAGVGLTSQDPQTVRGVVPRYWVVFKLLITVFATVVLLIYMQTFRLMAAAAADPAAELHAVRNPSPLVHAVLALVILLVATVLAIYKPQAVTPYGRRKLQRRASQT
jgi:uncharacterized membrane protein